MFEKLENLKQKQLQVQMMRPSNYFNTNTKLRGHLKTIGKYQFSFDHKLGSGFTSQAYIGINKQTNQLVCVKIIDRNIYKNQLHKCFLDNQIKCQQKLQSQYIVNIYDVYDTNSFCFVITQICQDGDLFKLIKFSKYGLPQSLVIKFAQHLSQALLKMKQFKIVHRDIKSENILLKNGIAKLGDFGFAIEQKDLKEKQDSNIGSPLYMPLETLQSNKYSYQSDMFSFGVVLYQMLHGQSPWQCSDEKQLISKMKTQQVSYKNGVSQKLQEIINSCLQMEANKRSTVQRIITELKQLEELIQPIIPQPKEDCSAKEIALEEAQTLSNFEPLFE